MSLDSFIESKNIRLDQQLRFTAEIRSLWEEFNAMQTKRMAIIRDFMPEVYKWVEKNLDNAVAKKWLVS